jgi:hypothetical protein
MESSLCHSQHYTAKSINFEGPFFSAARAHILYVANKCLQSVVVHVCAHKKCS